MTSPSKVKVALPVQTPLVVTEAVFGAGTWLAHWPLAVAEMVEETDGLVFQVIVPSAHVALAERMWYVRETLVLGTSNICMRSVAAVTFAVLGMPLMPKRRNVRRFSVALL